MTSSTDPVQDAKSVDGQTPSQPAGSGALPGFILLFAGLYAAYGTESAYMPAFLGSHRLPVERIGAVLAAGTLVRIVAGPLLGRLADRLQGQRLVLAMAAGSAALIGSAYLVSFDFLPLLMVSMAHATATASLAPLSDSLAVGASTRGRGFQYGWVRGAGSASFVAGTLLSGQLVDRFGLSCIILASSTLFVVTALCATRVEGRSRERQPADAAPVGTFRSLFAIPAYRRMLMVAALVIGSQAMNDGFAVIGWREAGYGSGTISLLWSESVLAEVLVFVVLGPVLLARLGPAGSAALAACAGIVRWSVLGSTSALAALVSVQALHGLIFALMHLTAMRIIAASVPDRLSATAQTVYGTFALGLASAVLTLSSGYLYGWFGMRAFWVMAGLCVLALPLVIGLRDPAEARSGD